MRADFPIPLADFCADLLNLPDQIEAQEEEVLQETCALRRAKEALETREGFFIEAGEITGANEKARSLQLRALTVRERQQVAEAQEALDHAACRLRTLNNRLAAYRAATRLIGGDDA